MLTTTVLVAAFLAIGFIVRKDSARVRLLLVGIIVVGIILLMRGN